METDVASRYWLGRVLFDGSLTDVTVFSAQMTGALPSAPPMYAPPGYPSAPSQVMHPPPQGTLPPQEMCAPHPGMLPPQKMWDPHPGMLPPQEMWDPHPGMLPPQQMCVPHPGMFPPPPPSYDEAMMSPQVYPQSAYPAHPQMYQQHPYGQMAVPQQGKSTGGVVTVPNAFNAGARFDSRNPPSIPPPPPGCPPNAAQLAAMGGHAVVATRKSNNIWGGGAGGGAVFW
ncbi:unnamed protein product [Notodromas monacha]|uniref:DAZ-associated protein 2 n=1 Tax=Notodromas monacha TaxID=399045 RepID=A0A7R9BKA8_9CRUS|nr:unnamed protein product [Notodromas monacha]CAG0915730.1 unnamed protein product [Notodromas monacha]